MKIALISSAFYGHAGLFNKALLDKGLDVDFLFFPFNTVTYSFPYATFSNEINQEYFSQNIDKYDYIIGLEQGLIDFLNGIRQLTKAKIACQILDVPVHEFSHNSYYRERSLQQWSLWSNQLENIDYVICNNLTTEKLLKSRQFNHQTAVIQYPIEPIDIQEYERTDTVLYVGRASKDKGIYNIINALSFVVNAPTLVCVSSDKNIAQIKSYADYMNVKMQIYSDCGELDKYRLLHQCLFTVSGSIASTIPALLHLEGLAVGRSFVCFDWPTYRDFYGDYGVYVKPLDIGSFSEGISDALQKRTELDEIARDAKERIRNERSYDNWAKSTIQFLGLDNA